MVASRAKAIVKRILPRHLINRLEFEALVAVTPVSEVFGLDRGISLDRVFITRFLQACRDLIRGDCLEVEEMACTHKFDQSGHVAHALKFSASPNGGGEVVADLSKPETVPQEGFDTFICTQTLNFIFDLDPVFESIHRLLKPSGRALITVARIFPDLPLRLRPQGGLLAVHRSDPVQAADPQVCHLQEYGHQLPVPLGGLEDIPDRKILDVTDQNYQMVVCAVVRKQ
ncbi:hypothetical protein A9J41_12445 [Laribacter hongkongensis]|uniref:methyltransferase domain-containing protein n=1 Tax=Laribacter hongkongensis TaxID=168471 RepID=UPI001878437A|nr:methyltransferase domain-containing protein [Laribacter hongkongensis]MBE5528318.1 hypothetical protein [Laribacter hongkongensis]